MIWSFSIGRIAGTEIRVHVTFFLLLAWIGVAHYRQGGTDAAIQGIIFILIIFACVVAHEFGHIFVARRYGIHTPTVTLLPIGGVAQLERMPEKPQREFIVALAGPAVNFAIAGLLMLLLGTQVDKDALGAIENPEVSFAARVVSVNLFLGIFNLIPAFPMDGGRILRALLSLRYSRVLATKIASNIGQILAFFFGFLGLLGNPLLIFIAIFVYLAAAAESQSVEIQTISKTKLAQDVMITRFQSLKTNATIGDAADALLKTTQQEFPVVDGSNTLRGFLTKSAMIKALTQKGRDASILEFMDRDFPLVTPDTDLENLMKFLISPNQPAVGVNDSKGNFIGYVTFENFAELMMIEAASMDKTYPA